MTSKRGRSIPDDENLSQGLNPETNRVVANLPIVHWSKVEPEFLTILPSDRHLSDEMHQLFIECRLKGEKSVKRCMVVFDRSFAVFKLAEFVNRRFKESNKNDLMALMLDALMLMNSST